MLLLALTAFPLLLSACGSIQQDSDWRWQQMNPDYHMSYPANSDYR
jgi:hypothetical protein